MHWFVSSKGDDMEKKCFAQLPEGYTEQLRIDLQKDKKLVLLVNGIAIVLMLGLLVLGCLLVPFSAFFSDAGTGDGVRMGAFLAKGIFLLVGLLAYLALHELTHGICMKIFGSQTVRYGFTGLYAYAGSQEYYRKVPYLMIALAPIVLWGVVLGIAAALVPLAWFWPVYFLQVVNISGASGDLYVTWKFSQLPKEILVQDSGVAMTVFGKTDET